MTLYLFTIGIVFLGLLGARFGVKKFPSKNNFSNWTASNILELARLCDRITFALTEHPSRLSTTFSFVGQSSKDLRYQFDFTAPANTELPHSSGTPVNYSTEIDGKELRDLIRLNLSLAVYLEKAKEVFARLTSQPTLPSKTACAKEIKLEPICTSAKNHLLANKAKYGLEFISYSNAFQEAVNGILDVADSSNLLLIRGETGVGKTLLAKLFCRRRTGKLPYVVNASISSYFTQETLELFHGRNLGAPVGLVVPRIDHARSTVNEITSQVYRQSLVSLNSICLTTRSVNDPLQPEILSLIGSNQIFVPALIERTDDIVAMFAVFLETFSQQLKHPIYSITERAINDLLTMKLPGNIFDLERAALNSVLHAQNSCLTEIVLERVKADVDERIPLFDELPSTINQVLAWT